MSKKKAKSKSKAKKDKIKNFGSSISSFSISPVGPNTSTKALPTVYPTSARKDKNVFRMPDAIFLIDRLVPNNHAQIYNFLFEAEMIFCFHNSDYSYGTDSSQDQSRYGFDSLEKLTKFQEWHKSYLQKYHQEGNENEDFPPPVGHTFAYSVQIDNTMIDWTWCMEHCQGKIAAVYGYIFFENKEDYALFKLKGE
jgi:hypothetical protein